MKTEKRRSRSIAVARSSRPKTMEELQKENDALKIEKLKWQREKAEWAKEKKKYEKK